jgi:RNA polymerase sigma-70 factor (ECF subfamily)
LSDPETPEDLRDAVRTAWHHYVDMLAPLRPALHAYCRRLSGNLWDAEDLVQDTLLRAFGHLGFLGQEVGNPKAYLLRTATHLWIDGLRRRESEARAAAAGLPSAAPPASPAAASELRDAGERLLGRLSPQERAAVVLKESFGMTLEEIAELLVTTPGAVKAALHRGRGRLRDVETTPAPRAGRATPELVDRWIALWNARDLPGLLALMLDGGSAENVGCGLQYGRKAFEGTENFLYKSVHGHSEWPPELQPEGVRVARAELGGESVLLAFSTRRGREALETILRFDEVDGRVARIRGYAFCPETMRAAGELLGLRVRTGLYRYPTPAPGRSYSAPLRSSPRA